LQHSQQSLGTLAFTPFTALKSFNPHHSNRSDRATPMNIEFSIWLASKTRWAHLTKSIPMEAVPRVGEFMKFQNKTEGNYFAWKVTQVTYREAGTIEVWTELLDNIDDRGYSFETEEEFDEYVQGYFAENWHCLRGIQPNKRYNGDVSHSANSA
jgi:hypothetical protein